MRFAIVAIVLCSTLAAGFGYTYSQEGRASKFITAPVERGSIATVVKASGSIEAVVTVDVSSQLSGRVEMWRGGFRLDLSVCRPFRLAVPI